MRGGAEGYKGQCLRIWPTSGRRGHYQVAAAGLAGLWPGIPANHIPGPRKDAQQALPTGATTAHADTHKHTHTLSDKYKPQLIGKRWSQVNFQTRKTTELTPCDLLPKAERFCLYKYKKKKKTYTHTRAFIRESAVHTHPRTRRLGGVILG